MANSTDDAVTPDGESAPADAQAWPAFIPHREIDGLLERIENAARLEPTEAARLLRMISREAQRLRAMALRMTTEKLAEADREASGILSEALTHADSMRSIGLATLNSRLDEADRLMATVREAFRLEVRATDISNT